MASPTSCRGTRSSNATDSSPYAGAAEPVSEGLSLDFGEPLGNIALLAQFAVAIGGGEADQATPVDGSGSFARARRRQVPACPFRPDWSKPRPVSVWSNERAEHYPRDFVD